ncbi:MAG: GAF and ANTAR domain-containing protein [Actinobacteria bacterium]|nr:GAF and ANTAR domain-containing protein [Actinomycetota bacterium]
MVDDSAAFALLQRFAETLVRRYDLDEVLSDLAGELKRVLDVAGAGVMLADENNDLRFVSSSDEVLTRLEDLQIELGEGPCLRAYRTAAPVIATDLHDDERFPNFGPRAVESGMVAVFSYPLQYEEQVFGALNLYRREPGTLDEQQQDLGAAFSDISTLYLMHGSDDERREQVNRQLQGALDSRVIIEQAKGFVAASCGLAISDAFEVIRRYARGNGRKLREVASQIVQGHLEVDELPLPSRQ